MTQNAAFSNDLTQHAKKNIGAIKSIVVPILVRNDVQRAAIFGSLARGDACEGSDLDLLVEFKVQKGLFDFIGLQMELESALGRKVDLVTYRSISPDFQEAIMNEQITIL